MAKANHMYSNCLSGLTSTTKLSAATRAIFGRDTVPEKATKVTKKLPIIKSSWLMICRSDKRPSLKQF